MDYQQQANDFLTLTGTEFKAEFIRNDYHFDGDTDTRDIYKVTLSRGARKYSFKFGQSLNDSAFKIVNKNGKTLRRFILPNRELFIKAGKWDIMKIRMNAPFPLAQSETIELPKAPDAYSVLACLTKYDVGTFEDFCGEFGYDTDSRKAKKTYKAVREEYLNVCALFSHDEIELLQEIN